LLAHLAFVAGLLVVAYLFAQIAYHAGLPAAAATTLVGVTAASMFPDAATIALTPVTIAPFLPAIIFDAAWEIDGAALRRRGFTIAILAVPGVIATAAIVAGGTALAGLALVPALTLGALLAATDPVAVIALFRTLKIPADLRTIVEGESIANDGVAAVLTTTLVGFAIVGTGAHPPSIPSAVLQAVYAAGVGIAIGAAVAFVAARFVRANAPPAVAIAITLVVAYGSYALATLAGTSGIFASAAAGIALRSASFAKGDRENVARAWDGIGFVANAIVFLLVGLNVRFERIFHEPLLIAVTIASVIVARVVLSYAIAPIGARPKLPTGWRHTIALAGLRGGLSLALALGLPLDFPARPQILDAVFAVVFGTVVIGGWTLGPILRRIPTLRRS
jgi:CPA1 family monovalent cation:H+ antiporter